MKGKITEFPELYKYDKILAMLLQLPSRSSLLFLLVHVISCILVGIVGVFVCWWEVYPPLIPTREYATASLLTSQLKAAKFHSFDQSCTWIFIFHIL
jgi:hypothetical protein